jgi:hypothetical protein
MELKRQILESLGDPETLEKLYRDDKQGFTRSFNSIIADRQDSELIRFWKLRLTPDAKPVGAFPWKMDLLAVIILCLICALLSFIPDIFGIADTNYFYIRYLPVILFNGLIIYTFWQSKGLTLKNLGIYGLSLLILLLLASLLPGPESDSSLIALIHVPPFLWCFFGLAYISFDYKDQAKRIIFIRFNGELIIMTGLILIAGAILAGMTISLYELIGVQLPEFFLRNAVVTGSGSALVISFFIIRLYPNITARIAPVIARIFTPLVLVSLVVYLVSLLVLNGRIFKDRELLLMFNFLLLAVVAIIVFSISELDKTRNKDVNVLILLILACIAIITNTIALAAIMARLTYGLTPNRTIVLVFNLLIFINLVLITVKLYRCYFKGAGIESVERTIANYLTVYLAYTIVAMFVFPALFGFR